MRNVSSEMHTSVHFFNVPRIHKQSVFFTNGVCLTLQVDDRAETNIVNLN